MNHYEGNIWEDQSKRKKFSKKSNNRRYKNYQKNINSKIFANVDPKLVSVFPNSTKTFQTFWSEINTVLNGIELTKKQFRNIFQSLKNDKSPCFD